MKYSDTKKVSREEILFIRKHAPRGMWNMISLRTRKTRSQVDYQLRKTPKKQDITIIQAARDILFAATGLYFVDDGNKSQSGK